MKKISTWIFALVFVLGGWYLSARILTSPALPSPFEALGVLGAYIPDLAGDFMTSFWRMGISLAIGVAAGAPIGLFLGRSPHIAELFRPVLYLLYPVPKIVLLPILLVVFGLGGAPKIALIALTVFFQVIIVMRDAAAGVPDDLLAGIRSLGANKLQEWRYVIVPLTLPNLFTTLRVSSSVAIAVLFFAESIAGSTGLGYFIMNSWARIDYPRMFAGIVALAFVGLIVYICFDICERRATRYRSYGIEA